MTYDVTLKDLGVLAPLKSTLFYEHYKGTSAFKGIH